MAESLAPPPPPADDSGQPAASLWSRRGELLITLLLTTATLLTAWAGYQSAKWSGLQSISSNEASAARADSNALASLGDAQTTIDVVMFTEWLVAASDLLDDEDVESLDGAAVAELVTDDDELAGFLADRFDEDSLGPAFAEWLALDPLSNDEAPGTPFELDSYEVEALADAAELRDEAEESSEDAEEYNQQSDHYVVLTVLFATVLFLAGLSSKLHSQQAQIIVFGVGVAILSFALFALVLQPIEFGEGGLIDL